jgi:hypothetical protein
MANPALLDIDMSAVSFAAAHAELLTLKLDNPRSRPDADSKLRAIAAWANYVDDCALAFQARLYEHATAIADLEGAVEALEADPGVTDHGALTGLADNDHPQYLLAAAAVTDHGDLAGLGDNDHPQYALAASAVIVLAQTAQPLSITNTTTPTDLVNYSIPAGTLTTNRSIRVRMGGTYVNNSGGARIFTLALTLDGTTLYQDGSNSNGASALVTTWEIEFTIAAESATVVHMYGGVRQSPSNAPGTGLGALDNSARIEMPIGTVSAGVTVGNLVSGARVLALTFAHPTNTATQTMIRTHYSVELVP